MSSAALIPTLPEPSMTCERCDNDDPYDVVGLWSPDGLCGHEILVCAACWDHLNA